MPWGLILFARNVEQPDQVRALTEEFRSLVGREAAPVLVDQEGGRVQRLRPPHWRKFPPARQFGDLYRRDPVDGLRAVRLMTRLLAEELYDVGINVDCLPVLDVAQEGSHDVIGDRAYCGDPQVVSLLARAAVGGLMDGGVLPVIKHIPGHGRAMCDSHLELPVVEASVDELVAGDFAPFAALADLPLAMTAHIVFTAIDADAPSTQSPTVIGEVIRGRLGFDGLIMTDDLSMKALSGSMSDKISRSLSAGVDMMLHCNGNLAEMREAAAASGELSGKSLRRANRALDMLRPPGEFDRDAAEHTLRQIKGESR